jgi:hypothetical protein
MPVDASGSKSNGPEPRAKRHGAILPWNACRGEPGRADGDGLDAMSKSKH